MKPSSLIQSRGMKCSTLAMSPNGCRPVVHCTGGLLCEVRTILTMKPLWPATAARTAASPHASGFGGVGGAGIMGGAALGITEFDGAGLGVEFALNQFGETFRGAGKDGMAEGVHARFVRADFLAVGVFQAFAHDDDAILVVPPRFL